MYKLANFERYPMTASSPDFLAAVFGGGTIEEFGISLPENAKVVDVGAGLSTFGATIASMRPDIRWTNLDINYDRAHVSNSACKTLVNQAPGNVRYVAGNIVGLPEILDEHYDRAFSYNLVPHMLRVDQLAGRLALHNIVRLVGPEGIAVVGPGSAKTTDISKRRVYRLSAGTRTSEIDDVVRSLTSSKLANTYHKAVWASGVAAYPGDRFDVDETARVVLSDDGGQTQYKLLSRNGLALSSRLVAGAVSLAIPRPKNTR